MEGSNSNSESIVDAITMSVPVVGIGLVVSNSKVNVNCEPGELFTGFRSIVWISLCGTVWSPRAR